MVLPGKAGEDWMGPAIKFRMNDPEGQTDLFFEHDEWKAYTQMLSRCNFDWPVFIKSLRKLARYIRIPII